MAINVVIPLLIPLEEDLHNGEYNLIFIPRALPVPPAALSSRSGNRKASVAGGVVGGLGKPPDPFPISPLFLESAACINSHLLHLLYPNPPHTPRQRLFSAVLSYFLECVLCVYCLKELTGYKIAAVTHQGQDPN